MCTVLGCAKPASALGMCSMHYTRVRRHGTTEGRQPQGDPLDRLMRRVDRRDGEGGCWIWQGATKNGYAVVSVGGHESRGAYGHRLAYERLVGSIPASAVLHHLCEQPRCVNPAHLEPVTRREHLHAHGRGEGPCGLCGGEDWYSRPDGVRQCRECRRRRRRALSAERRVLLGPPRNFQREKTHCNHGHEYTSENTLIRPDGSRRCRECHRIEANERYHRTR
jgi:hypothetical protein